MNQSEIRSQDSLHAYYGEPNERAAKKQMDRLDKHCRHFISISPFFVLATSGPGGTDASPRGDAPGFVSVVDDNTLIVPDRMGNNRVDSMSNILENPNVGLLFLVPGMSETLRINGKARVTVDEELLEPMSVRGKCPKSGLIVEVEEVFMHCAKALMRSKLWDPDARQERSALPPTRTILSNHTGVTQPPETQAEMVARYAPDL